MKIEALTENPQQLVNAINKAITDGTVKTWAIVKNDQSENLYSHTPDQWAEKAMLKPQISNDRTTFFISWWAKNTEPTHEVKGYITGRFTEILLVHFANYFTSLQTTT